MRQSAEATARPSFFRALARFFFNSGRIFLLERVKKEKSNMKTEILITAIFLTANATAFVKRTARHLTLLRSQMSDKNWPLRGVKKFIFPLLLAGCAFGSSALAQSQ